MKIYIASCESVASGVKNNRKWNIYAITTQDGKRLKTFEGKYGAMIEQEVEVEIEERPSKKVNPNTNQPYTDFWIVEPKKAQMNLNDIFAILADYRERLEALEKGQGANLAQAIKEAKKDEPLPPF